MSPNLSRRTPIFPRGRAVSPPLSLSQMKEQLESSTARGEDLSEAVHAFAMGGEEFDVPLVLAIVARSEEAAERLVGNPFLGTEGVNLVLMAQSTFVQEGDSLPALLRMLQAALRRGVFAPWEETLEALRLAAGRASSSREEESKKQFQVYLSLADEALRAGAKSGEEFWEALASFYRGEYERAGEESEATAQRLLLHPRTSAAEVSALFRRWDHEGLARALAGIIIWTGRDDYLERVEVRRYMRRYLYHPAVGRALVLVPHRADFARALAPHWGDLERRRNFLLATRVPERALGWLGLDRVAELLQDEDPRLRLKALRGSASLSPHAGAAGEG